MEGLPPTVLVVMIKAKTRTGGGGVGKPNFPSAVVVRMLPAHCLILTVVRVTAAVVRCQWLPTSMALRVHISFSLQCTCPNGPQAEAGFPSQMAQ